MDWLWIGLAVVSGVALTAVLLGVGFYYYLIWQYLDILLRVLQEKPLFIIPRGQPVPDAEDVRFPTAGGLTLCGCYLRAKGPQRRGVIVFGLEFGSNRWSCVPYCEHLLGAGYDVFAFEPRNQGDSDREPGYEPLQWVADHEVADFHAALAYLKGRPDADPRGVGFFGISKGAGTGLLAGADDPHVRCFVTDGAFATHTTMVPYMRKWVSIYSNMHLIQKWLPGWAYGRIGGVGIRRVGEERGCTFPHLEPAMAKLAPRPLLMIHGAADNYIKPEMAESLFGRARSPKEFWLVPAAKHNQSLQVARDEYRRRVLEFFDRHIGGPVQRAESPVSSPAARGLAVTR